MGMGPDRRDWGRQSCLGVGDLESGCRHGVKQGSGKETWALQQRRGDIWTHGLDDFERSQEDGIQLVLNLALSF